MFFDSHAHYDDERFENDRLETIMKAFESGVAYILNASSNITSSMDTVSLTQKFDFVYGAVGVHPHCASEISDNTYVALRDFTKDDKIVAIGEIGLDYYYEYSPRDLQKLHFAKQIALAKELDLPIIIHDRDAHKDTMDIVKSEQAKDVGGVFHCYSGSVEMLREVLDNNFYISVGGALTFKNAKKLVEVVEYVPLDRLMIETDCPYLTPKPFRGKVNEPAYVARVAEALAGARGAAPAALAEATFANAARVFQLEG